MIEITKETVEQFLLARPGATQREIAAALPTGDVVYGSHKFVASAVRHLREEGKIADVDRCETCHGALTRGRKNLPLFLI